MSQEAAPSHPRAVAALDRFEQDGGRGVRGVVAAGFLAALVAAAYANALPGAFQFDDVPAIVDNDALRRPVGSLHINARSLLMLTFAANYHLSGLDPRPYHAVNAALHALNAVLLFWLAAALLRHLGWRWRPRATALLAAALFAVHPFATEAVTYVSGRSSVLAATFYLLGVLAFLWARVHCRSAALTLMLVSACFALACAAKQDGATLPLALLLVERVLPRDEREGRFAWVKYHAPLVLAVILAAVVVGPGILRAQATRQGVAPVGTYLLTQTWVALDYLRLLVVPAGLNVDPDVAAATLRSGRALLGLGVTTGVACLVALGGRRAPVPAFALGWFYVAILPSSSLVPLEDFMAEHRAYLGAAGVLLGLACAAAWAVGRVAAQAPTRPALAWTTASALLVLVGGLGAATVLRNQVWLTPARLWGDALGKSPRKPRPHINLAAALAAEGDADRALTLLSRALEMQPSSAEAHMGVGHIHHNRGSIDLARRHYEAADRILSAGELPPFSIVSHLIEFHVRDGREDRARAWLSRYARGPASGAGDDPAATGTMAARWQLWQGNRLLDLGRLDEAAAAWGRALELDPTLSHAANNLGNHYLQRGDLRRAEEHYRRALANRPDNIEAIFNLGLALEGLERAGEARVQYERFMRLGAAAYPDRVGELRKRLAR